MDNFLRWTIDRLTDTAIVAALLAIAGWLGRAWMKERLAASIRLETETQLERVRSEIREAESRISTLTSAGITAIRQMGEATLPARISAVQTLWSATLRWRQASPLSLIISVVNADFVREHGNDPKTKSGFKDLLESFKYLELMKEQNGAESARPFVSERAWALFFSLHSFYVTRLAKATVLAFAGKDAERFWKLSTERSVISALSIPEILAKYDADPMQGSISFTGYIESELMAELKRTLSGRDSGPEASREAANVIETVTKLLAEQTPPPKLPAL